MTTRGQKASTHDIVLSRATDAESHPHAVVENISLSSVALIIIVGWITIPHSARGGGLFSKLLWEEKRKNERKKIPSDILPYLHPERAVRNCRFVW